MKSSGVTGTQLKVLGEQEIEFTIRNEDYYLTFVHTFIVSPLIAVVLAFLVWISCSMWGLKSV